VLVLLLGPLLWVATFVVVGFAVRSFNVVQIGLAVAVGSLLFALVLLLIGRARRTRREE